MSRTRPAGTGAAVGRDTKREAVAGTGIGATGTAVNARAVEVGICAGCSSTGAGLRVAARVQVRPWVAVRVRVPPGVRMQGARMGGGIGTATGMTGSMCGRGVGGTGTSGVSVGMVTRAGTAVGGGAAVRVAVEVPTGAVRAAWATRGV
jgi:hypothetical protein